MQNVTVNNRLALHQRIIFLVMLVLLQFYSFGSDFFPDQIATSPIEIVERESPEVYLDFDDNASLRTLRQEQCQLRALEFDLISSLFNITDLHELIQWLEWRQSADRPLRYNLHNASSLVWFCTYII